MIKPPESFEPDLNGVVMEVHELDLPKYIAFRVAFSSKRPTLLVASTKDAGKSTFWTYIQEGRQNEAEGVGKLIEEYFKKRNV
jgi:hypothetical protein